MITRKQFQGNLACSPGTDVGTSVKKSVCRRWSSETFPVHMEGVSPDDRLPEGLWKSFPNNCFCCVAVSVWCVCVCACVLGSSHRRLYRLYVRTRSDRRWSRGMFECVSSPTCPGVLELLAAGTDSSTIWNANWESH